MEGVVVSGKSASITTSFGAATTTASCCSRSCRDCDLVEGEGDAEPSVDDEDDIEKREGYHSQDEMKEAIVGEERRVERKHGKGQQDQRQSVHHETRL